MPNQEFLLWLLSRYPDKYKEYELNLFSGVESSPEYTTYLRQKESLTQGPRGSAYGMSDKEYIEANWKKHTQANPVTPPVAKPLVPTFDTKWEANITEEMNLADVTLDVRNLQPPEKKSNIFEKAVNGLKGARDSVNNFANSGLGQGLTLGMNMVSGMLGPKTEYAGDKGNITQGLDSAYDTISEVAGKFGPYGKMIQMGMAANKLLGGVANKLGGGTDGMTTQDAILGSAFMQMTPLGLINGFGGKRADTITKDEDLFAQVGSSYGGSSAAVDDALKKSGKKYGLLSSGARKQANLEIAEAKRQLAIIDSINSNNQDLLAASDYMTTMFANRNLLALNGGYLQRAIHVGKKGMRVDRIMSQKRVQDKYQHKSNKDYIWKEKPTYEEWVQTVNPDFVGDDYDLELAFEVYPIEQLERWRYAVNHLDLPKEDHRSIDYLNENGQTINHLGSIAELPNGNIIFLKKGTELTNEEVAFKVNEYKNNKEFLARYDLVFNEEENRYYYIRKPEEFKDGDIIEPLDLETDFLFIHAFEVSPLTVISAFRFKEGGTISELKTYFTPTIIEEDILKYLKGGAFNLLPQGALHARLNHINVDNITRKGIPVVSESYDGKIELLAEIEHSEIILRLEVTTKIEELLKEGTDEAAIEAGKLLVQEILYNTIDNVGLLLTT